MTDKPKSCGTCQWFDEPHHACAEPRNMRVKLGVSPGGNNEHRLIPAGGVTAEMVCDYWAKPKAANFRKAE